MDHTLRDKKNDGAEKKEEHFHGGCCGGNIWQHILFMIFLFAVLWYFTKT